MEPFLTPLPRLVGHRGDSHRAPENTLEAFLRAVELGVDVIETDVHLTKDGHLVIWHDPTLERNTDGKGRVEDHTLSELKRLDAGFTFTQDGGNTFPYRAQGVQLITLEEALEACPSQRFNVDLKSKEPAIAKAFTDVVTQNKAEERVLCASFHLGNLKEVRRTHPHILTSVTTAEVLPLLAANALHLLPKELKGDRTLVFQVPVQQWGIKVITPRFIEEFHKRGAIIMVWTINEEQEMERLFDMGVDTLMSDNVALLKEVVERRFNR